VYIATGVSYAPAKATFDREEFDCLPNPIMHRMLMQTYEDCIWDVRRMTIHLKYSVKDIAPAFAALVLLVGTLCCAFALIGYVIVTSSPVPSHLGLPAAVRFAGAFVLAVAVALFAWVFRYRNPFDILVSTYKTIKNTIHRAKDVERLPGSEPLVLEGPQRHVRHPLYVGVVTLLVGWWLLVDYTIVLIMACCFFLWFNLIVIRFEEVELRLIFGEEYEAYERSVPRFFPSIRRRWPR
jgi:protein-S-isoprenylcysteine O-methyltransferase Ste14